MVITSELNEKRPTGGSGFFGNFKNAAFAAYVFPQSKDPSLPALDQNPAFKRRVQREEQRALFQTSSPGVLHAGHLTFAMAREQKQPSRLRSNCEKEAQKLRSSASSPVVGTAAEAPGSPDTGEYAASSAGFDAAARASSSSFASPKQGQSPQPTGMEGADEQTLASLTMNTRWYPHASTTRGKLELSAPKKLHYGVDPGKDVTHQCPYWEAEKHRFKTVTALPERRAVTPTKSLRWRSAEHWDNPDNHAALKVTQTNPSMRASQSGRWMTMLKPDP
jgi:hypothetical protein